MANKKQPTWESLIAKRNELHGDFKPLRIEDPVKRNRLNNKKRSDAKARKEHPERHREQNKRWRQSHPEYEHTPERKAKHKDWAQSEAGKLSMRKRGKKYYNTPKGKANALKKARRYYEAHKNDPAWKAHRRELQRAWRKKNRDKVAQTNARYRAKKKAS